MLNFNTKNEKFYSHLTSIILFLPIHWTFKDSFSILWCHESATPKNRKELPRENVFIHTQNHLTAHHYFLAHWMMNLIFHEKKNHLSFSSLFKAVFSSPMFDWFLGQWCIYALLPFLFSFCLSAVEKLFVFRFSENCSWDLQHKSKRSNKIKQKKIIFQCWVLKT